MPECRRPIGAIYINFDIDRGMVIMAKNNKKSKGPQDRNSNFQMKNGNPVSKKKEKKPSASKPVETKSAAQTKPATGQKSFLSGISSSITSATNSISKMFKR
jgi:hypothetical protein